MHEPDADAFAFDCVSVAVRADYDEFAVHPFTHRKFCKILHRPTIYTKTRVLQATVGHAGGQSESCRASVKSQAGSSKGSRDLASLEGTIDGSTRLLYRGQGEGIRRQSEEMPGGLDIRALGRITCWSRPSLASTCRGSDFAGHARGRVAFDLGVWGPDSRGASLLLDVSGPDFGYLDVCYRAEGFVL
jgi:hypothetical protein